MKHRVVGLASRIFNGGKSIFSFQKGVISKNFFERGPARQKIQDIGNAETKTPNAGAASALSFFHRDCLQPFDAHKFGVFDGLGQRARKSQPSGREGPGIRDWGLGVWGRGIGRSSDRVNRSLARHSSLFFDFGFGTLYLATRHCS